MKRVFKGSVVCPHTGISFPSSPVSITHFLLILSTVSKPLARSKLFWSVLSLQKLSNMSRKVHRSIVPGKGHRSIVDPKAWDSSEVGSREATAFSAFEKERTNKVSSIRSALFKKNACGISQRAQALCVDGSQQIFKSPKEAVPLQAPFTFESTDSLAYCGYGKVNKKAWTKDILALVHNAVRSELIDLTMVLRSIQKLHVQLRVADVIKVREWWQVCFNVVLDYFDLEMKHLMPWIQRALEGTTSNTNGAKEFIQTLPQRQKQLRDLVMAISKAFGDLCDPPAINMAKSGGEASTAKKAMLIVNSLDALVTQTCGYMSEQESQLPPMLTAAYKSEKKERELILKAIIKHLARNARKSDIFLVLLTRWMPDAKTTKSFTKTMLEIHECNYSSLQTQFEMNHAGFVHQFSVKAEI